MLLRVVLCMVVLVVVAKCSGYGGELNSNEKATAYLETTVSLFLGPEIYSELYKKQVAGAGVEDEAMEQISLVFERSDLDNNGELTREELGAVLGKNKHHLLSEDTLMDFHHLDSDKDAKLSWREYFQQTFSAEFVEKVDRGLVDIEAMHGGRMEYEEFYAYFKFQRFIAADSDKSDSLSSQEFLMFMKPSEYPQMRNIYYEEVMADIQTDDDDTHVSLEEYKASVEAGALLKRPDSLQQHMDKQLQKFRDLDLNMDGKLNRNESMQWMFGSIQTDHGHLAKKDVDMYFRICDSDGNNRIDFNEIIGQSEFIYRGIDPDEVDEFNDAMKNLLDGGTDGKIDGFFTEEALGNLAESERKKEMLFGSMLEEFSGVEGFDGDFFDTEHGAGMYEYDPEWDPDNTKLRWGFVKPTKTYVKPGFSLSDYVDEVKERNGYYKD